MPGDPPFDPFAHAGLRAQADTVFAKANEAYRAEAEQRVEQVRARADAAAYADDAGGAPLQGTLPEPPGFVGEVARFIYQQAPRPVAEVAVVGALGLMAGIAGREWHIPGSGLNLYVVLVARSAIGKEAMHTGIAKIINAVGEKHPTAAFAVDFADYVSGPALVKAVAQNPCFVNVAGEIGHKFLAMATDKDASMRSLRKALTTLYSKSGPDGIAGGIVYSSAENNAETTQAASFSLIGETTPSTFYESITDAMMRDGFMSRFCVIEYAGERPDKNSAPLPRPPAHLVDRITAMLCHTDLLRNGRQFQEVGFTDVGRALLNRFEDECDAAINAAGDDENLRQLWNRAHLKALRVAALLAVGDNYVMPSVTEQHAAWAITLIRHGVAAFDRRIRAGDVGEGSDGGRERMILKLCDDFARLPPDKLPSWLKHGLKMQQAGIVPRKWLQQRTQRLSAFENFKLGHTAALNMAIKTAMTNGNLMAVKKEPLSEQFDFQGEAFRVLHTA
jgi:hypothetical protein